MNSTVLETIERGPTQAESTVIWLHGLGADGHDFEPIAAELGLSRTRFVFPHAPVRPITINGGLLMRGWFDIVGFGASAPQDERGIRESAAAVSRLIDAEVERGVPSERITLAGFSQGGAIALHAALREPRPLSGVIALSSFLPLADSLPAERSAANAALPIFVAHGDADNVIPISMAEESVRRLTAEGYAVDWRVYPMAHTVCIDEVRDIAAWLRARGLG